MKRVLVGAALAITLTTASIFLVGELLTRPVNHSVGVPPGDIDAKTIAVQSKSGDVVAGWLVPGQPGQGVVLLLHGVRADRRQMLQRARVLNALGYSAVLIDLPGHGESTGQRITFGFREAEGVSAALSFIRENFPRERIGVVGVSLGAASFILSKAKPTPDAVVLESMYPTIEDATRDRLAIRLGSVGRELAPLLLFQIPLRLGIAIEQLRPISEVSSLKAPVLIASGALDNHTTLKETMELYRAAQEPKELWIVERAAHVDLNTFDPVGYKSKVLTFLAKYLRNGV